jgi:hypothetical protein
VPLRRRGRPEINVSLRVCRGSRDGPGDGAPKVIANSHVGTAVLMKELALDARTGFLARRGDYPISLAKLIDGLPDLA